MAEAKTPTLPKALGGALRQRREGLGLTQDHVARQARSLGLDWSRPVVAAIERGSRSLDLAELTVALTILEASLVDVLQDVGSVVVVTGPIGLEADGANL